MTGETNAFESSASTRPELGTPPPGYSQIVEGHPRAALILHRRPDRARYRAAHLIGKAEFSPGASRHRCLKISAFALRASGCTAAQFG